MRSLRIGGPGVRRFPLLFLLAALPSPTPPLAEEDAHAPAEPAAEGAADATPSPTPQIDLGKGAEFSLSKRPPTRGLFYGHIWDLDDEAKVIVVSPINKRLPRKRFYADSKTTYRQNKKKATLKDVYIGDKVAVRYFTNQGLAVADALFVVEGKFEAPKEYLPKKKKAPPKPAGEAPKKGGGH